MIGGTSFVLLKARVGVSLPLTVFGFGALSVDAGAFVFD